MKAYGHADRAVSDMETPIFSGARKWAVRGTWQRLFTGCKLSKQGTFLDPWP